MTLPSDRSPASRLVSALLVQVLIIVGLGLVLGTALYFPLTIRCHVAVVAVRRRRRAGVVGTVDGAQPGVVAARRPEGAGDRSLLATTGVVSRTMKVAPASFVGGQPVRHCHPDPDARRRAGDVPRGSAGRPHPQFDGSPARPGCRRHRLLRNGDPRSPGAGSRPTRATVEAVPGVARTGGIGVVQLGARVPGSGPRELAATALFGYELAPSGVPEPPAPGEVYADDVLRADGSRSGWRSCSALPDHQSP